MRKHGECDKTLRFDKITESDCGYALGGPGHNYTVLRYKAQTEFLKKSVYPHGENMC